MHRAIYLFAACLAIVALLSQAAPSTGAAPMHKPPPAPHKIKYVIIIFQENRTPDNLFQGLPGADIAVAGRNSKGQLITLQPRPLANRFDLDHSHAAFVTEYNHGQMNGWDKVKVRCHKPCSPTAFGYVPRKQAQQYFEMAKTYTFGDRTFQDNQGPSFVAHQFIISGTAIDKVGSTLMAAENPRYAGLGTGWTSSGKNCDGNPKSYVQMIDTAGNETQTRFPCFEHPTLIDLLDKNGITWRYYNPKSFGLWSAPDAIRHLRFGPAWKNVVTPETQLVADIKAGDLQQVSWIMPTCAESDHAECNNGTGPKYVAGIVDALGKSKYWKDTAIFITWDDWGGWFDHVKPPIFTSYELGFRVPLIVVSPYSRRAYVSHVQHEQASILRFVEDNWGLGTLGYADARADGLSDCFDFTKGPSKFVYISGGFTLDQIAQYAGDHNIPADDDF